MAAPTVAIVGAYGATGTAVARRLRDWAGCRLLVAGRDPTRAQALARELGADAQGLVADVHDRESLARLCAPARVVVNCTGPYGRVRDRVARVAMEHGCHYVDPGGYEVLGPAMSDVDDELRARRLTFVSSAGWLPGLDVVFLHHVDAVARRVLDAIERVDLYSGDRNCWSRTGTLDIVQWVSESAEPGFFENGAWRNGSTLLGPRLRRLPQPAGCGFVIPVFKAELERFAQQRMYPAVSAYQAMLSPPLLLVLGLVRAFGRRDPERAATAVGAAMHRQWARHGPAGLVTVTIDGRSGGRARRVRGILREARGYWPTGAVAAAAAELILDGRASSTGSVAICDAFDPAAFMAKMAERGIAFDVEVGARRYAGAFAGRGATALRGVSV